MADPVSERAHYRFPPSEAYPLNRCLYALKSDREFAERFVADPAAVTGPLGLTEGERADLQARDDPWRQAARRTAAR